MKLLMESWRKYISEEYKAKGKCVYKKGTTEKVGCTDGPVNKYLAALNTNVDDVQNEDQLEEKREKFTAPYQLFIPKGCADGACSIAKLGDTPPVENRRGINKPFGGLWTSTAVEDGDKWTSAWNNWMVFDMPHWMSPQGILIVPKTDNIFHVNTEADAEQLFEEFPAENQEELIRSATKMIDFEAALQKYDGIHFGTPSGDDSGAWEFGSSGAWDVESTVFRDVSVVEPVKVVQVKQPDD